MPNSRSSTLAFTAMWQTAVPPGPHG
jgi:hypothetical protein